MADISKNSKISVGLMIPILAGIWALWSYSRNVEAMISNERTERQRLEERVAWVIINHGKQEEKIDSIDQNVRANGEKLATLVAYVRGDDDEKPN